jgi:hypothetical protein
MKIAVIKLGARISYKSVGTSGGTGEAISIIDILRKSSSDVHIYTKILDKDENPSDLTFHQIEDTYTEINDKGYDALLVINGTVNFFGGAEAKDQILNYWLINKFNGKVFYAYCDPSLQLKQIWGAIKNKDWASNWNKEDIEIKRDDITYISQPYDLKSVKELLNKSAEKGNPVIKNIKHFPFEQFPCMRDKLAPKKNPTYDLLYGGTMRGNKRIDKMLRFYFGYSEDINVEMFGKIKPAEFDKRLKNKKCEEKGGRPPKFGKAVKYNEFMDKMNDSLAHVVIGDKWYEGRDLAQRIYESIWSSVVTFIDKDMDPKKLVYGDNKLGDFLYVSDAEEVEKKIKKLKQSPENIKKIIIAQYKAVDFSLEKYVDKFVNILKSE